MRYPAPGTLTDFINKIRSGQPVHIYIRIRKYLDEVILGNNDIDYESGIIFEDVNNGDENYRFGQTSSRQVTLTLLNAKSKKQLLSTSKEIDLFYDVGDEPYQPNWGRIVIGYFNIKDIKYNNKNDTVRIILCDKISNFDVPADPFLETISSPISLADLVDKMCDYFGISFNQGSMNQWVSDEIKNRQTNVSSLIGSGYSCRDILSFVAEAVGCCVRLDYTNTLWFRWWYDNDQYSVTNDYIYEQEFADYYPAYSWDDFDGTSIAIYDNTYLFEMLEGSASAYNYDYLSVVDTENGTSVNYPINLRNNAYIIKNNPFLKVTSQQDITDYIAPLYNRLRTLSLFPFNVSCEGYFIVEAGDAISIQFDNDTILCPIFQCTTYWNGGATTEYYETTGEIDKKYENEDGEYDARFENVSNTVEENYQTLSRQIQALQQMVTPVDITSSVTLNSALGFTTNRVKIYKIGKIIQITGYLNGGTFSSGATVYTNLPTIDYSYFRSIVSISGGSKDYAAMYPLANSQNGLRISQAGTSINMNIVYVTSD